MSRQGLLNRLPDLLENAWSHARASEPTANQGHGPIGITIAISREAGIESATIAHQVGKLLSWPVYDHELLERIAEEMQLRPDLLERIDERPVPWLVERLETFLAAPPVSEPAYLEHLIATLLSLSMHGRCVVVGRGAAHLLPAATTFRVRLVAPLQTRVETTTRALGVDSQEASRRVKQIDREWASFVRQHFKQDSADAHNYDLLVNCERFHPEECAELVVRGLGLMQWLGENPTAAARGIHTPENLEAEAAAHS
jgi:cytidylate kinase